MSQILVSGSIAHDYIMSYNDNFKNAISINNVDSINWNMLISEMKKETGWTGLNIAYNLAMLWENAVLLGSIWNDFIFDWLLDKINLNHIYKSKRFLTASAYVTNDKNWNQMNVFYPWAMMDSDKTSINDIKTKISHAMISPNQKEAMIKHLKEAKEKNIKTFFDPGQILPLFSKKELIESSKNASYLIANQNEFEKYQKMTDQDEIELLNDYEKIIVTLGSKWSKIIDKSWVTRIDAIKVEKVIDPTWAWDSYRAWLLKWLTMWHNFEIWAKIWSIVSSYCVQFEWWQNHFVNMDIIEKDLKKYFDIKI